MQSQHTTKRAAPQSPPPVSFRCTQCGAAFELTRGTTQRPPLCLECTRAERSVFKKAQRIFQYRPARAFFLCEKCNQAKPKRAFDWKINQTICRACRTATPHTIRADRIKQNGGAYTRAEWDALKAQYAHTCLRCGRSEPQIKLCADHVKPIARGGTSHISNIQPLCAACNSWKHARTIDFRK